MASSNSTLADDQTPVSSTTADNINVTQPLIPYPNLLKSYASYSPILTLLVTNTSNYNEMVINAISNPSNAFDPTKWDVICKSGGVGPKKAQGFNGGSQTYFENDMYFDSATVTTIVGMSQENRGSNATEIELTIIEPYGMDFIEQLYDYCNLALGESNYCQIPYMLMIEFRGWKDDGSNELVPNTTKHIPIHLLSMDIKVNNMGAIYKISALPFNELSTTEQYGRISSDVQIGSSIALAKISGLPSQTLDALNSRDLNAQTQAGVAGVIASQVNSLLEQGNWAVSEALQGNGSIKNITDALATVLNNVQQQLYLDHALEIPDVYSIVYSPIASSNNGYIDQALFLDLNTLTTNVPVTAKDTSMGTPLVNQNKSVDLHAYALHIQPFAIDSTTGETGTGVTYGNQLISFNAGSSILDCLNTLLINSNYIVAQISHYNQLVDNINNMAASLSLKQGSPIPSELQTLLDKLQNTTLDWFHISPVVTQGPYDRIRRIYSRNLTYTIQPYKIYNSRSISAPNGNPLADNRVVKEYDYIFTGKNTEILTFDLQFNNAFYTYAQFNHDTKGQSTGTNKPANQVSGASSVKIPNSIYTKPSPINAGNSLNFVSSSNKSPTGIGAQTPERNQAADIAATIYAPLEQIQLDLHIYGDPDFIRQDGIFTNPVSSVAFDDGSKNNSIRGILFNTGEVYANVNFKIPQDLNLNTGVLDLAFNGSVEYHRNVFSGQYHIVTVTNKFDHAAFTQELNLIRFDDSHDSTVSTGGSNSDTTPTTTNTEYQNTISNQLALDAQETITPLPQSPPKAFLPPLSIIPIA